jgi:hypothetical protein
MPQLWTSVIVLSSGLASRAVAQHEGHNGKDGGAILPESLRWLWRDTPAVTAGENTGS